MNQDRVSGICLQFSGTLKECWGKLAGNPRAAAAGKSERFAGRILEQRGLSAAESDRQLAEFMRRNRNWSDVSRR